jgi:hypothetical protein
MIMVTMVVVTIVVMVVMVIAMIVAVPVSFVEAPSFLVMVIVWMAPVGAGVRRPVPTSGNPDVLSVSCTPIAVDPSVAFAGGRGTPLIAHWGRCSADIDADLCKSRHREHGCNGTCTH